MEAALHRRHQDEKLANQLAAFGLLGRTDHAASPKPAPSSSPIPFEATPKRGYCATASSSPIPFNPIYVQGLRGWVFESEPGQVRFVPVRGSGPAKKSGGTGVFLPRVSVKEQVNKRNNNSKGGREQRKPPQQQQRPELVGPTFQPSSAELASLLPQEWSY